MAEREFSLNRKQEVTKNANDVPAAPDREHGQLIAKRVPGKRKETAAQKFRKTFLADDIDDIGNYLVTELIVPTIKDIFLNFMTAVLWGDRRSGSIYRDNGRRTDYNGISRTSRIGFDRNRKSNDQIREEIAAERRQFDLENIVLATRDQADTILNNMEDYLDKYGQVTVGYLFELLGENGPYTVEYYGWRNLDRARIKRINNGYLLDLPRPVRIEA